jgi:surfactin synthase thioesterase subunit
VSTFSESRVRSLSSQGDRVWVTCGSAAQGNPASRVRLFCFPYAGAGASIFRSWQADVLPGIQICRVQLPGREERMVEPPFTRLRPLIDALMEQIRPLLDMPFAFFGHCMGALVAFELARSLRREGREPVHLLVSALRPPQLGHGTGRLHRLRGDAFQAALVGFDGIPRELQNEPEFLKIILPTLRADFETCETYEYSAEAPLGCPISVYSGRNDTRSPSAEMILWKHHTAGKFSSRVFPGNHFFIESSRKAVLSAVSVELLGSVITGRQPAANNSQGDPQ